MSSDDEKPYEVGYGKPPLGTRFQQGQSGNKNGREKGVKNLTTDLKEELSERVTVTENGKKKKVSKQRLLIKTQVASGLKGNGTAASKILEMAQRLLQTESDAPLKVSPEEQAVIDTVLRRIKRSL